MGVLPRAGACGRSAGHCGSDGGHHGLRPLRRQSRLLLLSSRYALLAFRLCYCHLKCASAVQTHEPISNGVEAVACFNAFAPHATFAMLLCVTKQPAFTSFGQYDYLRKYSTLWLPLSKANDRCKTQWCNCWLALLKIPLKVDVACRQHEGDGCVDGGGCHG